MTSDKSQRTSYKVLTVCRVRNDAMSGNLKSVGWFGRESGTVGWLTMAALIGFAAPCLSAPSSPSVPEAGCSAVGNSGSQNSFGRSPVPIILIVSGGQ